MSSSFCLYRSAQAIIPTVVDVPYLRMVDVQSARWVETKIKGSNDNQEICWREGLKLQQEGRVTKVYVHLGSSGMTCEDVSDWCVWFGKQLALLQKRGGAQVIMEKANFSRNQIGNHGVSTLVTDVFANFLPRKLLLFGNNISDVSPLVKLLAMGTLRELHLSNNKISADAACRLVVVATSAKDQSGKYFYPIQGLKPLWLRLENNPICENFQIKLAENLCRSGRAIWKAVCFVDGTTRCNPSQCHCGKEHVPGIHLTYVGSNTLNRRRSMNKLLLERKGQHVVTTAQMVQDDRLDKLLGDQSLPMGNWERTSFFSAPPSINSINYPPLTKKTALE
jgi:hypothetical protein